MIWPPVYKVKKHRRARHVRLSITRPHGLQITIPYRFSMRNIPDIIENHRQWITSQLEKIAAQPVITQPSEINLQALNQCWKVQYSESQSRLHLRSMPDHQLILSGQVHNIERCNALLNAWVKKIAKEALPLLLEEVSNTARLPFGSVTIRDQKTLWGSCTAQRNISLNFRLLFLPASLAKHVMIHELCHTKHLNHSARFWQLVSELDPGWRQHKQLLRQADQHIPSWAARI